MMSSLRLFYVCEHYSQNSNLNGLTVRHRCLFSRNVIIHVFTSLWAHCFQFYLILNVAVGGGWFWEGMVNAAYPQPWKSNSTKAEQFTDFWNARHLWEPTWHGENVAMRVRSVRMEQY